VATTSSKQAKQRVPAAERRDALIAAAIEEFAIAGLHGTPVDRIARRVGVAQPYVFSLFPSKRDLFIAAVHRGFEMVTELFAESAARFLAEHPEGSYTRQELLGFIGDSYVALVAQDRHVLMFQLQSYAACDDEIIRKAVNEAYEGLMAAVGELTGATDDELSEFFSMGMWLNVQAAIGRPDLETACQWIARRRELRATAD